MPRARFPPTAMLVGFSFKAKPRKERGSESLLDHPEAGRAAGKAMGATRNILFLRAGRIVRLMGSADGVTPLPLTGLARRSPDVARFLRTLGPLIQGGFDLDRPGRWNPSTDGHP